MKRPQEIAAEEASMGTIVRLTSAFESLASMRIMRNKNRVLKSRSYFRDIWQVYSQIRVDPEFNYGRHNFEPHNKKELYLLVTADTGLSGNIDQRLVDLALKTYNPTKNDIIVIGKRGALQLAQHNIACLRHFKLPLKDSFNVEPLVKAVQNYQNTKVFYQTYQSLTNQEIKALDINAVVESYAKNDQDDQSISEANYIFEPSTKEVVAYFERTMIRLTITEAILESRLAQDASRFITMKEANDSANEAAHDLYLQYRNAKRNVTDQRLKEIMSGLRKIGSYA